MEIFTHSTSSIDATWPPVPASQSRLRGFYTDTVISDAQSAANLNEEIDTAIDAMHTSPQQISRVSIRAVVALEAIAELQSSRAQVEAVLPIADSGLGIVYLGANTLDRSVNPEDLARHRLLLAHAAQNVLQHRSALGFDLRILDGEQPPTVIDQLAALYAPFGYDRQDTQTLIQGEYNLLAVAACDGQIVSTAMAEFAEITIGNYGELHIAEITEASTLPSYSRQGFYAAVSRCLIEHIIGERNDGAIKLDVLYGESNLTMPGVIKAAAQNGRRFCHFDEIGVQIQNPDFGILPQNFSVNDGTETRQFNDFAVSYVPL